VLGGDDGRNFIGIRRRRRYNAVESHHARAAPEDIFPSTGRISTEPGKTVLTVTDLLNPQEIPVAPPASGDAYLSPALKAGQSLSLEMFIRQMVSPRLDPLTTAG
jgi:hypothetical protein